MNDAAPASPSPLEARASLAVLALSAMLMIVMGLSRYLRDGSLWQDEAWIAYNILSMPPGELFGPLDSGHRFPALYLSLINQLRLGLGYETWVLRLLPFSFFVIGVAVWHRLLWQRFRAAPAILVLAAALTLVPGTWFVYAAMFKQYSLDVLVALLPFMISDAALEQSWCRGEKRWRLGLWMLPCLVSYTYPVAILGRIVGYALGRFRRNGIDYDARSSLVLALALMMGCAGLWLIDLRHSNSDMVLAFWKGCIMTGDPWGDARLVGAWFWQWFDRGPPFSGRASVSGIGMFALIGILVVGIARALNSAWSTRSRPEDTLRSVWGTRSFSALVTLGGFVTVAELLSYPMCAGRLSLFVYFSLILVMLDGMEWVVELGARVAAPRWVGLAPLILAAVVAPVSAATVHTVIVSDPPENIRPMLPAIAAAPEVAIVVGPCSGIQVRTLPEWLGRDDIFFVERRKMARLDLLPDVDEFWLVGAGGNRYCSGFVERVAGHAVSIRQMSPEWTTAKLLRVRLRPDGRTSPELRSP